MEKHRKLGNLEGLIYRGGTQTPDLYKGFAIEIVAKSLNSLILDSVEGLGNYSLPRKKIQRKPNGHPTKI